VETLNEIGQKRPLTFAFGNEHYTLGDFWIKVHACNIELLFFNLVDA